MYLHESAWIEILAARSRARQVCIEVQNTRRLAAQTRYRARLTYLARYMPEANPLTRAVTAEILAQHGLFSLASGDGGGAKSPSEPNRLRHGRG